MICTTLLVWQICATRENYGTRMTRIERIITDYFLSVLIRMIGLIRVLFLVVASPRYVLRFV